MTETLVIIDAAFGVKSFLGSGSVAALASGGVMGLY